MRLAMHLACLEHGTDAALEEGCIHERITTLAWSDAAVWMTEGNRGMPLEAWPKDEVLGESRILASGQSPCSSGEKSQTITDSRCLGNPLLLGT